MWKLSEEEPQAACFVSADVNYGRDADLAVSDSLPPPSRLDGSGSSIILESLARSSLLN